MEGVKLTGLWREKTQDGKTYLSGRLNAMASVLILPNDRKREGKDPDYYLLLKHNPKAKSETEGAPPAEAI